MLLDKKKPQHFALAPETSWELKNAVRGRATTLIILCIIKSKKLFIPLKTIYSKSIYSYYVLCER